MKFQTWVRAALLVAVVGVGVVMMPFDWCSVVDICQSWFAFMCDHCPPLP